MQTCSSKTECTKKFSAKENFGKILKGCCASTMPLVFNAQSKGLSWILNTMLLLRLFGVALKSHQGLSKVYPSLSEHVKSGRARQLWAL